MNYMNIRGHLGFGGMRLPVKDNQIDKAELCRMIDEFIANGFNYFDTAHGYHDGASEKAFRECLTTRYEREDYVLTNKLSSPYFEKEADVVPLFESQLELCGVEYFDFYLFHAINRRNYEKHKSCNTFEIVRKLKENGKIKRIGMSFHDTSEVLDVILSEQPDIEVVQLQINYLDYDDPTVQSKACYDVAVKHGKKVIVMEPVKGGVLANLPEEAANVIKKLGKGSQASHALRYAASFPEVFMVLSGMSDMEMLTDNISTFNNFHTIDIREDEIYTSAREIIRKVRQIPCTKCNYCTEVCPLDIPVSKIFSVYNDMLGGRISRMLTRDNLAEYKDIISECLKCGKCEANCPQSIKIREILGKIYEFINV